MPDADACLYFDFLDPLSYLVDLALTEIEASRDARVARVGYELRPPPAPVARTTDPIWADRWDAVDRVSPTLGLHPPAIAPWTRKAHELHALAERRGNGSEVRRGIFEAYFGHGRDIGRIDVLVEIAADAGLDRTETKAALDVDAHEEDVLKARRSAQELGLVEVPALLVGRQLVQGFHNLTDLGTLLGGPPRGGR
jgi:2-hydroxychromene-2-carboxylate isomerase